MIWINGIDFFGWVPLPASWHFGSLCTRTDVSWRVKPEAIDRTTATTSTWTKMRSDMPQVYFILHSWPQFDDSLQVLQVWVLFHVVSMYPKFRYRKDMIGIETWKHTYVICHTPKYMAYIYYTSYKQQVHLSMQSIQQSSHSSSLKVSTSPGWRSWSRSCVMRSGDRVPKSPDRPRRSLGSVRMWPGLLSVFSRVEMAHDDGLFFTLREICCLSCQSQDLFWFDFGIHMDFGFHWGESLSAAAENRTWHAPTRWPRTWLHASVKSWDHEIDPSDLNCEDWCAWNFSWRFCVYFNTILYKWPPQTGDGF